VELCGFIVDDRKDWGKMKRVGREKNKSKHLRIKKVGGTGLKAQGLRERAGCFFCLFP
jgi:hypothetical protein